MTMPVWNFVFSRNKKKTGLPEGSPVWSYDVILDVGSVDGRRAPTSSMANSVGLILYFLWTDTFGFLLFFPGQPKDRK
jgi:hypothetical protein